jgi:hypothetical protein
MKKLFTGLALSLLSLAAYASGTGYGNPGMGAVDTLFYERLDATEESEDGITYVRIYRWEYTDGYARGHVSGSVDGKNFSCSLPSSGDLLEVRGAAEEAVITVDQDDIESCAYGEPPWPITFDCVASGARTSQGIANEEHAYYDGREYKIHSNFFWNAVDCVAYIGEDIELDAQSGIVQDGWAKVYMDIYPYQGSDD